MRSWGREVKGDCPSGSEVMGDYPSASEVEANSSDIIQSSRNITVCREKGLYRL